MKTIVLTILALASCYTGAFAQSKPTSEEKSPLTKEQRIALHADRQVKALMLDDATTAKFKPMYEKYLTELAALHPERGSMNKTEAAPQTKTDAEVLSSLKDQFAKERKALDIREKYFTEFGKVLSPKQLEKVFRPGKMQEKGCGFQRNGSCCKGKNLSKEHMKKGTR